MLPADNRISVHRHGSVFKVNTHSGKPSEVRKLPGYLVHRAVSILSVEDTQMPGSISITEVKLLNECHDLMALIDHTERLLHSGRQITPLAAAQMAAKRASQGV